MTRKQVGALDSALLAEVDKRAEWLGQTRREFIERALWERLTRPDVKITSSGIVTHDGRPTTAEFDPDWPTH